MARQSAGILLRGCPAPALRSGDPRSAFGADTMLFLLSVSGGGSGRGRAAAAQSLPKVRNPGINLTELLLITYQGCLEDSTVVVFSHDRAFMVIAPERGAFLRIVIVCIDRDAVKSRTGRFRAPSYSVPVRTSRAPYYTSVTKSVAFRSADPYNCCGHDYYDGCIWTTDAYYGDSRARRA